MKPSSRIAWTTSRSYTARCGSRRTCVRGVAVISFMVALLAEEDASRHGPTIGPLQTISQEPLQPSRRGGEVAPDLGLRGGTDGVWTVERRQPRRHARPPHLTGNA